MNRRDFHRTLIAGAGMAAMPAWANLLPTPEDMLCGHELRPGVRCMRQTGHEWEHRAYEQFDAGDVAIHEWNNDRVVWRPMDHGRAVILSRINQRRPDECIDAVKVLKHDARLHLGPGEVFELRRKTPENYCIEDGIAWYWQPAPTAIPEGFNPHGRTMIQTPLFEVPPTEAVFRSGYMLFGRLIT